MKNIKSRYIVLMIATIAVGVGLTEYLHYQNQHPSTDDAYVNAHVVQIAPQVSGLVQQVFVSNHQAVQKGQLLFRIDPKPFEIALANAKATLANTQLQVQAAKDKRNAAIAAVSQAKSELVLAQVTATRYQKLYHNHFVAKQALDTQMKSLNVARAAYDSAKDNLEEASDSIGDAGKINARIAAAQSAVDQATLNLSYTEIKAPVSGRIAQLNLRPGDAAAAMQTTMRLIDEKHLWVDAHFKETQVGEMAVGMPATVHIDMYPDKVFQGKITGIAYGSGDSFSVLPSENDSGNWVKVTQRFTVKIQIDQQDDRHPLRIGSSANVKVTLPKSRA